MARLRAHGQAPQRQRRCLGAPAFCCRSGGDRSALLRLTPPCSCGGGVAAVGRGGGVAAVSWPERNVPTGRAGQSCKRAGARGHPLSSGEVPACPGLAKTRHAVLGGGGTVTADSGLRKTQNFPVQEFSSLSSSYIQISRSFVEPRALRAIHLVVAGMKSTEKQPGNVAPDFSSVQSLSHV